MEHRRMVSAALHGRHCVPSYSGTIGRESGAQSGWSEIRRKGLITRRGVDDTVSKFKDVPLPP